MHLCVCMCMKTHPFQNSTWFNIDRIKSCQTLPPKTVLNTAGLAVKIAKHCFQVSLALLMLLKSLTYVENEMGLEICPNQLPAQYITNTWNPLKIGLLFWKKQALMMLFCYSEQWFHFPFRDQRSKLRRKQRDCCSPYSN